MDRHKPDYLPFSLGSWYRLAEWFSHRAALPVMTLLLAALLPCYAETKVTAWGLNDYGQSMVPADLNDAVSVVAGWSHSAALRKDGTVVAWGGNWERQSTVPQGLQDVVALSSGAHHTLALRRNGTVAAWGYNAYGQLNVPADLTNAVAVAGGAHHSLVLRKDGAVVAWGWNDSGQVNVPAKLEDVSAIAAGYAHNLALRGDGTVVAWGDNSQGQCTVPADLTNAVMVSAGGQHSLALCADGRVAAWGANGSGQLNLPSDLTNVVALAAGYNHSLALRADGMVVAWGDNSMGQTNTPAALSGVGGIASGYAHGLAFTGDAAPVLSFVAVPLASLAEVGTTYLRASATGALPLHYQWNRDGVPISGATNALLTVEGLVLGQEGGYSVTVSNAFGSVTSGEASVIVVPLRIAASPAPATVSVGSTVRFQVSVAGAGPFAYQWQREGVDLGGQTNDVLELTNVSFAAAGSYSVKIANRYGAAKSEAASLSVLSLAAWGLNDAGQLNVPSDLTNAVAVSGGYSHTVVLRRDGTVAAWGGNEYGQASVPSDLTNVIQIAAGGWHNLALRSNGTVAVWGANNVGQGAVPSDLTNAVAVAAGGWHNLALRADGTVVAWGENSTGQTNTPSNLNNVVAVSAGLTHSLALRGDGTVVGWGVYANLQTNAPTDLTNAVMVASGAAHGLALRSDGTVVAWGNNDNGQLNVPSDLVGVVAVAGGGSHSLALRSDGKVVLWGGYSGMQTNLPAGLGNVVALAAGNTHNLALGGDGAPSIDLPSLNRTIVAETGHAYLRAAATGALPLSYQWSYNGSPIPGATNAVLEVEGLLPGQSHRYSVRVSNRLGVAESRETGLLLQPLRFAQVPVSRTALAGSDTQFMVNLEGMGPFTYQWKCDAVDLPGQTNETLRLAGVSRDLTGNYSVKVTNRYGTLESPGSSLRVQSVLAWGRNDYGQTNLPPDLTNVAAVAAGYSHAVALRRDGTVVAWGGNWEHQATVPDGLSNVVAISVGAYHTLALRNNGTVVAWGYNGAGQINIPTDLTNAVMVAAGAYHSLALRANGTVVAWGSNENGQSTVPVLTANVTSVAGGTTHSLALLGDGTVIGWGYNGYQQATAPTGLTNAVAIAGGDYHSLALRADGTVLAWGAGPSGQTTVPSDLKDVVSIAAGPAHSVALRHDGSVVVWGDESAGQLRLPADLGGVCAVGGFGSSLFVLGSEGPPMIRLSSVERTLVTEVGRAYLCASAIGSRPLQYQWSRNGAPILGATNALLLVDDLLPGQEGRYSVALSNSQGTASSEEVALSLQPLRLAEMSLLRTAILGGSTELSVRVEGAGPLAYQWRHEGVDLVGETGATLPLSEISLAAAGDYTVKITNRYGVLESPAAKLRVRSILTWGQNDYGQASVPEGLTNAVAVSGGYSHAVALRKDGTVIAWGGNWERQTTVPDGLSNVVAISVGAYHTLALRGDGTVAAWGYNAMGQINVPPDLTNVVMVAAGANHSLALQSDGKVVAWGLGDNGQATVPANLGQVVSIAAGGAHSLALRNDGTVVVWGDNTAQQAVVPSDLTNVVAVAAGHQHSLALRADGTVVAWGSNAFGQANVPVGLKDVACILGGVNHSAVLRHDGSVVVWGDGSVGQTDVPTTLGGVAAIAGTGWFLLALGSEAAPVVCLPQTSQFITAEAGRAYLHATVTGGRPLEYQWSCNGVLIPGATSAVLRVQGLLPGQGGRYRVAASNGQGTGNAEVVLTVQPLRLDVLPAPFTALVGGEVRFSVHAEGVGPFTYQWLRGGVALPHQTNDALVLTNVPFTVADGYSVRVANRHGTMESRSVPLRVQPVLAWGANDYGQASVPAALADAAAITCGYSHTAVLGNTGGISVWGDNTYGQRNVPADLTDVVAISAGGWHNLALRANGTVVVWGANNTGQANVPSGLSNVVAVAGGGWHNLALRNDGTVAAWGDNSAGQANVPPDLEGIVGLAAGRDFSLALRGDGTVAAWGNNGYGQASPPAGLTNAVMIAAGLYHSLALRADGTVVGWGHNEYGQSSPPLDLTNAVTIAAGIAYSAAVRSDGTMVAWGDNGAAQLRVPPGLSGVSAIAAGSGHTLIMGSYGPAVVRAMPVKHVALAAVGRVYLRASVAGARPMHYQWSRDGVPLPDATNALLVLEGLLPEETGRYSLTAMNSLGASTGDVAFLSVEPLRFLSHPQPAAAVVGGSAEFSVTVTGVGTFSYQWRHMGVDLPGATNATLALHGLTMADAGDYSVLVGNSFGTVESWPGVLTVLPLAAWGANASGQTVIPPGLSEACAIAAGHSHVVALLDNGTVVAWGLNDYGQASVPAGLTDVIAVAAGAAHSVALRSDGTVVAWGGNWEQQATPPSSLSNVVSIACGAHHTLALRADGTVVGWGSNLSRQIYSPVGLTNILAIAAGVSHSLALRGDGAILTWGDNTYGQLLLPPGLNKAVAIAAGGWHNLALRADGTVAAWGGNDYAQTAIPGGLSSVVAIAAGSSHSLALKSDGTIVGWGSNGYGESFSPTNLPPVVAVAAGPNYSLALPGQKLPAVRIPVRTRTLAAGLAQTVLRAYAAGGVPVRYQWALNGKPIAGANRPFLVLREVPVTASGTYTVTVQDATGATATADASVTVLPARLVATPQSVDVTAGQSAAFSVSVEGVGPFTYQWRKDGLDVPGAIGATLQLASVYFSDAGQYSVRVSNSHGTVESPSARLRIPNVVTWGSNASGQLDVPGHLTNAVAIAGRWGLGWALREDRTLAAWGDTNQAQSSIPAGVSNVIAFAVGGAHVLVLRQDRTVTAWGSDSRGQSTVPADLRDVMAVAAGYQHSLALRADGTVAAWGDDFHHQTDVPDGLEHVVAIAAGDYHSLALQADGTVVAWGRNSLGQGAVPTEVVDAVAIAAGGAHNLALLADGSVKAWGENANGQIRVPWVLGDVVAVSAQGAQSMVLRADGTVLAWGENTYGQSNPRPDWNGLAAIAAGVDFNLALHGEGAPFIQNLLNDRVVIAGTGRAYLCVATFGEWPLLYQWQRDGVDIAGQTRPVLAIEGLEPGQDARYSVRISNRRGQVVSQSCLVRVEPLRFKLLPESVALTRGGSATFSVTVEGQGPFRYQWRRDGIDLPGQTNATISVGNAQENVAGNYTVFVANRYGALESPPARLGFREVLAWGYNWNGEVNVPPLLGDVVQLAGGENHNIALRRDGSLVGWGGAMNGLATLPQGLGNRVAVAGGPGDFDLALLADGTLEPWGRFVNGGPLVTIPAGLDNVVDMAVGAYSATALRADGTTISWSGTKPTVPPSLNQVVAISAGWNLTGGDLVYALRTDGTVLGWGAGRTLWTELPGLTNIVAIASFGEHVLALRADGTVTGSGNKAYGQLKPPPALTNAVAIAAGFNHSLALRGDGTVVCWGANFSGQTNTPAGLSNVVAIAAGWDHTLAQVGFGAPVIRPARPQELVISDPSPVFLYSQAVGAPPLLCQWRADSVDVPGATNWWLRVDQLEELHSTRYQVVVRNAWGAATNLIASLTRQTSPPLLSEIVFEGGRFRCTVTRTSAKLPCVIWQSADLEAWTPAYTNAPTAAGFEFLTPPVQGTPARFYRATITP